MDQSYKRVYQVEKEEGSLNLNGKVGIGLQKNGKKWGILFKGTPNSNEVDA